MPRKRELIRQTQSVRQNVNVIVQTAPPKRRKRRSYRVATRDIFDRITSQNLRDATRREGVSKAVARHGSNIHNIMPYEKLERIAGGASHIVWNRNEPEQVLPRLKSERPADIPHETRMYLRGEMKDVETQMTTGRRPISLASGRGRRRMPEPSGRRTSSSDSDSP